MTNGKITKTFFATTTRKTVNLILDNIAAHYGITRAAALDEVTHDEAEHLLDYVTGPERAATHLFMRQAGLSPSPVTQ
jgi:uncharacterized phage-associated protein